MRRILPFALGFQVLIIGAAWYFRSTVLMNKGPAEAASVFHEPPSRQDWHPVEHMPAPSARPVMLEDENEFLSQVYDAAPGRTPFEVILADGETVLADLHQTGDSLGLLFVTARILERDDQGGDGIVRLEAEDVALRPDGAMDTLTLPKIEMYSGQRSSVGFSENGIERRFDVESTILPDGGGIQLRGQLSERGVLPSSLAR